MIYRISAHFLTLVAHSTIIFTIFYNQERYLLSSLPPSVSEVPDNHRVHFTVVLCVTFALSLAEFLLMLRSLPSFLCTLFSVLLHTLACLFLLKFIVDIHPADHFLWLLLAFSVPPVIVQLAAIVLPTPFGFV